MSRRYWRDVWLWLRYGFTWRDAIAVALLVALLILLWLAWGVLVWRTH